jgi:hypothetical protein
MPLSEMANLFMSLHLAVAPGLVCSLIFVSLFWVILFFKQLKFLLF